MTTSMHWARWGDPAQARPLSDELKNLVVGALGVSGEPDLAVEMADVRLPDRTLPADFQAAVANLLGADRVRTDHETRVRHTRGKSTPDLIRIRTGDGSEAPDAVVFPGDHEDVQKLIELCVEHRIAVVPFGGGTSVVGGLAADGAEFNGVVALDVSRLNRLVELDTESQIAHLEPGLLGPAAEALVAERGYTIGHFPQSFEYASIGGFAAARSSGQASAGYGRFDANVVGLTVATPIGTLEVGSSPANAAGPDLRQVILGSEGAFGVITKVAVRVRPVPVVRIYEAWRFGSFAEGAAAMRTLAQDGPIPTVLRLSDEAETFIGLAKPDAVGAAEPAPGCLMITGYEGTEERTQSTRADVTGILTGLGGSVIGEAEGRSWSEGRYGGPYLRDSLLDTGVLVETLETATFWSNMTKVYDGVRTALTDNLTAQGTPPLVLCHISHVYATGVSLYFTVACKKDEDGLEQWAQAKAAASRAMIDAGATISHHHAVGRDHRPWLAREIGPVGVEILRAIKDRLDPTGVLNPGVMIP
ncbi:MAG: FAD-binding oxidoreductase [Aeromicrobium sp.]